MRDLRSLRAAHYQAALEQCQRRGIELPRWPGDAEEEESEASPSPPPEHCGGDPLSTLPEERPSRPRFVVLRGGASLVAK